MVAVACVSALTSGCMVSKTQHRVIVGGAAAATVGATIYTISRMLAHCPDGGINGEGRRCEEERFDDRDRWAKISLVGLLATIGLQLLIDTPREAPPPSRIAIAPPPPPPASANELHSPVAVQLAHQARVLASGGKCIEAMGSLRALAREDRELADQLRAWDPSVSRCRTVTAAANSETAVQAPTPSTTPAGPGGASTAPAGPSATIP
jgi:hypothetical protein